MLICVCVFEYVLAVLMLVYILHGSDHRHHHQQSESCEGDRRASGVYVATVCFLVAKRGF